ncbi:fluoride efflux transporter CrcB [Kribbella sp. CA-294648]|uniref:fluoride efflux transporter CrcB n=1 Tax=Kribbella sp. CA-294648 TaxID=3239948 RepID=UPI003D8B6A0B
MQRIDPSSLEPVDPDVDLRAARRTRSGSDLAVVGAVALGGMIGAAARYLIGQAWPTPSSGFPWATFTINVTGCALIGVLMVLVTDVWQRQRLLRPFLGTGVLGGYTTFSTYTVDIQHLLTGGHPGIALSYLAATPVAALVAVWLTAHTTRRLVTRRFAEGLAVLDNCEAIRCVGRDLDHTTSVETAQAEARENR